MGDNVTAVLTTEKEELPYWEYPEYKMSRDLYKWASPFLMFFGTVGGVMTLVVMSRKSLRTASSVIYFCTLAVVDMLVLHTGLMRYWLRVLIDVDIRRISSWSCKLHYFSLYSLTHYSAWILVAVSIERLISVTLPFKSKVICSQQNACITLVVILIAICTFNGHFFWTRGERIQTFGNETIIRTCTITSDSFYDFDDYVWPWIDFSLLSFCPALIMIICNIGIVVTLYVSRKRSIAQQVNERRAKMTTMTAILLLTNTSFLLLTAPVVVFIIADREWRKSSHSEHTEAKLHLSYTIVILFSYLNHSVNFVLYCICGPRFRRELKAMFCVTNRVQPQPNSLTLD